MAKIYSTPKEIVKPVWNFNNMKDSREREEKYIQEVKDWCKQCSPEKSEYVGEMITIPHADSHACYMVFKTSRPELIHLEIGDAWHSSYAELLTSKRIKEMIEADRRLKKLFS